MKRSQLRSFIQETLKESGYAPTVAPTRPAPSINPGKKEKPGKHPLFPPKDAPKTTPKGLFKEGEMVTKITDRYKRLKGGK